MYVCIVRDGASELQDVGFKPSGASVLEFSVWSSVVLVRSFGLGFGDLGFMSAVRL